MEYFVVALFVLAILHFVLESAIMPSIRFSLRCKLFALRDDLRKLRESQPDKSSEKIFNTLDRSICSTISFLPYANFSVMISSMKMAEENPEFKKKVEDQISLIKNCGIQEVQHIAKQQEKYGELGLISNTAGWLLYFVPIAILVFPVIAFGKQIKKSVANLSYGPKHELASLMPSSAEFAFS